MVRDGRNIFVEVYSKIGFFRIIVYVISWKWNENFKVLKDKEKVKSVIIYGR